jgi:transcriptional regulator with XRE-family HTH domain
MNHKRAQFELAIAETIRKLHGTSGLERKEIAQALEMPELEITRLENGSEPVSAGGLMILLELYDISWKDFVGKVAEELPGSRDQIESAGHTRLK